MAKTIQLKSCQLIFPKTEESEVLTEDAISSDLGAIEDAKEKIDYYVIPNITDAQNSGSSDGFYIEGVEELSSIIDRQLKTKADNMSEDLSDVIEKIKGYQQTQEEKDRAIIAAYQLAEEAEDTLALLNNALYYQEQYGDAVSQDVLNGVDDPNSFNRSQLSLYNDSVNTYSEEYQEQEEAALEAYREAANMEPNESGDYTMSNI